MSLCRFVDHPHCLCRHATHTFFRSPAPTRPATLTLCTVAHSKSTVGRPFCLRSATQARTVCRFAQQHLPLCPPHCLAVCHSHTICRSIIHTLSAALPLTRCLSLCAINRSDTRAACPTLPSLSISQTLLSFLYMLLSYVTSSRCTPLTLNFRPLILTRQAIPLNRRPVTGLGLVDRPICESFL